MDYGHELLFGTFITPAAQRPHHAVELAVVADRAGLDLVTFQDHPYQPGFLDTWTLLTYVAARTSRVRLSHNVLNLPLRPPVMLARAAASVDLLSGGRFELGIGAGRVWDAIEAMGGPRRTPGEAVEALEEAITIIREVWAADRAWRCLLRREALPRLGSAARTGPGARHRDLGRGRDATHASPRRAEGGWLVRADPPVPAGGAADAGRAQPRDRRGCRGGRP